MDTFSSQGPVAKASFDSEPAAKEIISDCVRISVEGFTRSNAREVVTKLRLSELFKSCGYVYEVVFPPEHLLDRRAFLTLYGDDALEKALQLNGRDMGGWKALVKFAPEEEEEEYKVEAAYRESLCDELENDKRFKFGICVEGYDNQDIYVGTSFGEDEIERSMRAHFSSCGDITHVYVNLPEQVFNIYFSEEEGEAKALDLDGSEVDGFKITVHLVTTTVRSKTPFHPGETQYGYACPAHLLEFGIKIEEKIDFYMTEWRLNKMSKQLMALKKQKAMALGEPKAKALKKPMVGVFKKSKAWALRKRKAKALKKLKAGQEGEGSQ